MMKIRSAAVGRHGAFASSFPCYAPIEQVLVAGVFSAPGLHHFSTRLGYHRPITTEENAQ